MNNIKKKILHWLPQVALAILVVIAGVRLLQVDIGTTWQEYLLNILSGEQDIDTRKIPSLVIGTGLLMMTIGLLLKSRVAWLMTLFLLFMTCLSVILTRSHEQSYLLYCLVVLAILMLFYRIFDKSSLLASTIFTVTSVLMVIMYATFGNYYLGSHFNPKIDDLITSLYFAMVTMSTVGFGDISPQTPEAKLFTVSVIIMGLTVFATSIMSIFAPLLNNSLSKVITQKGRKMKRNEHFIVIGHTALGLNICHELAKRGKHVTRILETEQQKHNDETFDSVYGQASKTDILIDAGVDKAEAVISVTDDDSDNAFVILAVKQLNHQVKTIVSVNDSENIDRVKLAAPDIIISPDLLGGELTAMLLAKEEITSDFVMQKLFKNSL